MAYRIVSECIFSVFYYVLNIIPSVATLPEDRQGGDRMLYLVSLWVPVEFIT